MYRIEKPTITHSYGEDTYKHPAYGMLNFSRCQCSGGLSLFGSSIKHSDYISLKIRHAEMKRGSYDRYYGNDTIVECRMSYTQFAQAISAMNQEPGIPVTLDYVKGEGEKPGCDFENKRIQLKDEFDKHIHDTSVASKALRDEVRELLDGKKPLNKSEKAMILARLDKICQNMDENTAYIAHCFDEHVEDTITEAKAEIEAFVQSKMLSIANQTIVEKGINVLTESPVTLNIEGDVNDEA